MSVSFSCHCPERRKPVKERRWRVLQYKCNHSAFNGYKHTVSDWSEVVCLECRAMGRTKAAYVDDLKMMSKEDEAEYYKDRPGVT